jgi:hypothetical protein
MSGPVFANKIGEQVIDLLGLPKQTREVHMHIVAGELVTIDASYYPDRDCVLGVLGAVSTRYELRERTKPKLQLSPDFKWCTPEFRAETDRWLLERFGTKPSIES